GIGLHLIDFIRCNPIPSLISLVLNIGNQGKTDVPIFNTKDMRLGIGLHLIDFIRCNPIPSLISLVLNIG
ncbi:T3SS effector OspC family protein, partial [Shigella flexneri]|nr:T3SS effector OspC family protein [Shigella flexneri]